MAVGYTMDTLYFKQSSDLFDIDRDMVFADFGIIGSIVYDCSTNDTSGETDGIFNSFCPFLTVR